MAIRRKEIDEVRARLSFATAIIEAAHKRAANFQQTHQGIYAEIFGEKNLHEPLMELRAIDSTLRELGRKVAEE